MGIMKSVLEFLTGKDPDIFDEKGNVSHKLPKKKWEAWHNRTKTDPTYNWRNHTGITGAPKKKSN
ncbi:hypothetical protein [Bdellovibrio sp. HCB274]|uniref:hypothetical protein n=1 Tax=Bdellovibrio sp. HCB274 TaxID=3394361 RepID=UPI0039B6C935